MRNQMFSLAGKVAVVTGGSGVLGFEMARVMAEAGAKIALLARNKIKLEEKSALLKEQGFDVCIAPADVTSKESLAEAKSHINRTLGKISILVNAAGGNIAGATIGPNQNFFDIDLNAYSEVVNLNLLGTVAPSLVFAEDMASAKSGCIINISSMTASRPITRVVGYANAKAAIDNFTKWLSTEMISKYGEGIRVNAIAPGFFLTEQNRTLLTNPDGTYTDRAKAIIANTPMARFGKPEELASATLWLASDASSFVSGIVVPVDGGFSAYGGL